MTTQY